MHITKQYDVAFLTPAELDELVLQYVASKSGRDPRPGTLKFTEEPMMLGRRSPQFSASVELNPEKPQ